MQNPSLWIIVRYYLVLGGTVFGGPLALAAHMRQELVDRYRWLTVEEYTEGLAMATALPGPIAYQLGIYAAWLRRGWRGGIVAAICFVLPPFLLCLIGAIAYVEYRSHWIVAALFYGISPAVIALIVKAGYKLGRATFDNGLAWGLGIVSAAIMAIWRPDPTPLFVIAAIFGVITRRQSAPPPQPSPARGGDGVQRTPEAPSADDQPGRRPDRASWGEGGAIELELALFFFKAACILFGSGLVIVPFMQRYVVDEFHWMNTRTFLDAVAIGMMTPGPVVITATFVGYVVSGLSGAIAATIGMFTPSVLFIFCGAPILRRFRERPAVQGAIHAIAAAVVGTILGSSVGLATASITDYMTIGIFAAALFSTLRWKIPDIVLIIAAGAVGVAAKGVTV